MPSGRRVGAALHSQFDGPLWRVKMCCYFGKF